MAKPQATDASAFIPDRPTLDRLREAAAGCRGCHLWKDATQTVFGDGLKRARIVMVGEMPGDREDLAGRPFVGPAGRELDRALEEVGIDRRDAYVTNVVKHFKFTPRGKRRIHQKPNQKEISACRPWLEAELEQLRPEQCWSWGRPPPSRFWEAASRYPATGAGCWTRTWLRSWR